VATSFMVADNEHPRTIQHRLGHADPRLTMGLYAHVPDEVDRAAADRLEALWRASRPVHDAQSEG
jgi:integrase